MREQEPDPLGLEPRGRLPFSLTADTCADRRRGRKRRRLLLRRRLRHTHRRNFA